MAGQNRGDFITTTQSWDVTELKQMDVSSDQFRELFVRMYQQLNNMAQSINTKASGRFNTQEFATGETFYPSPSISSASNISAAPRSVFRRVVNMLPTGTLPNTGTLTVAHGLTFNSANTLTRLYGAATNAAGTSLIPIPYASPIAANNIELYADATNIYIVTGKDQTAYTKCNVIMEFLKN